ncbi:hypothetical protein [Actibacterium sp. MT2.3-13A]|uniref:hypothetical protein n=1 Tax=Actibacterium sp. MT2.3-13A TaxID=2828332 RepID=UPI001BAA2EE1|nr:hypothetical protein [Actibacterium sp. MT2.3-13A]
MIFKYDPATLREELHQKGYAHLKDVLSDDFVGYLKDFYETSMKDAENESEDWKIAGKKRQFVFNFPSTEAAREFKTGLARLTGIDENTFTISERHLKVYDEKANPYPAPHKDRSASSYSIGLPVFLPKGSTVCLFPDLDAAPNTEDHAVFLTERDRPDIEKIYEKENALMLNESVGDIVIFLGSALWHERVRGAGTAVLYVKVNGEGVDPLGENIYAAAM